MKTPTAILAALFSTVTSLALGDTFGSGANTFDIPFVFIGNPGNADDTDDGSNNLPGIQLFGSVNTAYRIGKFEISEQMIDKANTLGSLGITKDTRSADQPATAATWNEAARFVNWLNMSTGSPPAYKFARQPGDSGYSANANIQLWTPSDAGYNPSNLYRNSLARYFLPSADEWYKAAYFDPSGGAYYNYPTGSDTLPTEVASGTAAGTAVYRQFGDAAPADITLAGGLSPYGTMGQGGNVFEWEETYYDLVNESSSSARGIRGGFWSGAFNLLRVLDRFYLSPTDEFNYIGFRIASAVPEPNTLLLAIAAFATLLTARRKSVAHNRG